MKSENARSETYQVVPEAKPKTSRHYRSIRNACLGCAKPVHLVRMTDGTWEWQHDGIPTAEMMERHRARGIGRQVVSAEKARQLIENAEGKEVAA